MIYIDIHQWGKLLLPSLMRKDAMLAFLRSALTPVATLLVAYNRNADGNMYRLHISPQVFSLERMLNDRYDYARRRIFITDGERESRKFIYTKQENKPVYAYTAGEGNTTFIKTKDEKIFVGASFVVNIPASLMLAENEATVLVGMYKLPGKSFTINRY